MRTNAFQALVELAHQEQWCWNLSCTTCGHMHYRYALLELAKGLHPFDPTWAIHPPQPPPPELGALPRKAQFTKPLQQRILELAAQADLEGLFERCGTTFTLGSIGVVLNYCAAVEAAERIWSPVLTAAFRARLVSNRVNKQRIEELCANDLGYWTWTDLGRFEKEL